MGESVFDAVHVLWGLLEINLNIFGGELQEDKNSGLYRLERKILERIRESNFEKQSLGLRSKENEGVVPSRRWGPFYIGNDFSSTTPSLSCEWQLN